MPAIQRKPSLLLVTLTRTPEHVPARADAHERDPPRRDYRRVMLSDSQCRPAPLSPLLFLRPAARRLRPPRVGVPGPRCAHPSPPGVTSGSDISSQSSSLTSGSEHACELSVAGDAASAGPSRSGSWIRITLWRVVCAPCSEVSRGSARDSHSAGVIDVSGTSSNRKSAMCGIGFGEFGSSAGTTTRAGVAGIGCVVGWMSSHVAHTMLPRCACGRSWNGGVAVGSNGGGSMNADPPLPGPAGHVCVGRVRVSFTGEGDGGGEWRERRLPIAMREERRKRGDAFDCCLSPLICDRDCDFTDVPAQGPTSSPAVECTCEEWNGRRTRRRESHTCKIPGIPCRQVRYWAAKLRSRASYGCHSGALGASVKCQSE